jgi:hypothetical protein
MDARRRSVANDDSKAKKPKKRVAGQSEMLMSIVGSGKAKMAKAAVEKPVSRRQAS